MMMNVLAKRINEAFSKKPIESKFKALAEKYCSPENCNLLTVSRVNPGIWNDLPRASKKLDVGLQEAQKSAVHHYNYSFNKRDFSRGKSSHYKKDVENKA